MQNCHMSLTESDFKGEWELKCKGMRTNNDGMLKARVSMYKWDVNLMVEFE